MDDFTPRKEPPITIARIDNQCPRDPAGVAAEFGVAAQMATIAANNFNPANRYVQAFWPNAPDETREKFLDPFWLAKAQSFFLCVARAATNIVAGNCGNIDPIHVTCVEDGDCATKNGYATLAHADHQTSTINLCNAFFGEPTSANIQCVDGNALKRYESKARALVHEITHLNVNPLGLTDDVQSKDGKTMAYGTGECTNLAMNDFPDNESDMAIHNADNYAYIAAGTYWLDHCRTAMNNPNFRLPADPSIR